MKRHKSFVPVVLLWIIAGLTAITLAYLSR